MKDIFEASLRGLSVMVLIVAMTFIGCTPLYIPNVVNTPLFSNKNEIQASVHYGTAGFDPQIAYAITNNIGVMVNASFEKEQSDSTSLFPHKHAFGELGVGYFKKVTEKQRFEIYGGYGIGKIEYEVSENSLVELAKINTNRFFIQPAYGTTSEHFDFSIASRIIWITGKGETQNYTRSFWEPAVTLRAGGRYVKGVMQIGLSVPFREDALIEYEPLMFSFGIQGSLGKIFE